MQECFVAAGDSQTGSESRKESRWRATVGAPETDFLPPFLNPGICSDVLEDTALL